jgi:hypothetical protein
MELINFVVVGHVNATASDHPGVPLACAGHQLVRTAAGINHCTGIAVVSVQALVALNASYPDNRVVNPVSRCDPRRASAVLTCAPSAHNRGRICRCNFVG